MRAILSVLSLALFATVASAQTATFWQPFPLDAASRQLRDITPERAWEARLDTSGLRAFLASTPSGSVLDLAMAQRTLALPLPDGSFMDFHILETPLMHPDLAARYPYIRTYSGVGVQDPSVTVKFDLTPAGFHAMVLGLPGGDAFVDPAYRGNSIRHQAYWKHDLATPAPGGRMCSYEEVNDLKHHAALTRQWVQEAGTARAGDCQFRTYRLALACTGEYANFFGATGANKAPAIAAMATSLNRVNGIYERDAALTMVLVANNDQLVFTNPSTDGYTNNDGGAMLGENQTKCNAVIGSANYDIGHVFSTGGGGVAYLNSPCTGNKAGGVTGSAAPVGDPFDIDYVAHEMGHQYGGNHSQNNNCNRAYPASVEVGSGITIMGYAGICAPDVANHSIAMFGGYGLEEIHANITTGNSSSCPQTTALVNSPPSVGAGTNRVIPKGTPFILTATASDPDAGDQLTYSWEQMDPATATQPPVPTNTGGPAFLPKLPVTSPSRYFPELAAVIANTTPTWEVLANVGRTYNFRVTVRDNAVGGGCNDQDDMVVTVNGSAGPFLVTQPNTAVTWQAGGGHTVTWDVAGTSAAPVSCSAVDILLSVDGGLTYPYTLATATPNDGSQLVTMPNLASTTARVMVRASANIFYDISNQDFTIEQNIPDYTLSVDQDPASACMPANGQYTITVGSILGYSDPVSLSAVGLAPGLSAAFSTNPVVPGNTTTLTLSGTGNVAPGNHPFTLHGTGTAGVHDLPLTLHVGAVPGQVAATAPADGATGVAPGTPLEWGAQPGAEAFHVRIATDAAMTNVVENVPGISGTDHVPTVAVQPNTTYYWNVRGTSPCGDGPWSTVRSFTTAACSPVTVQVVLDAYGSETSWLVNDAGSNTVLSGSGYTNSGGSSGTFPQPDVNGCLAPGCYTLVVNDSYGDGICCSYGNGSVTVIGADGFPLASVSSFGSQGTATFCLPVTCQALPYSEDFELGAGDWTQTTDDDMDWTRLSGDTPSSNTGPQGDHTTGSGYYFYTEASSPNSPSKAAHLVSACFDLSGLSTAQLSFWYNMYGAAMGTLNVDIWDGSTWNLAVWSLSGDQGTSWTQAAVNLDAFAGGTIRVRFRGITGADYSSDMAIDDIQIDGASAAVALDVRAFLEGPYDGVSGMMGDDLRAQGYLPTTEPFTGLGFPSVGGGGESVAPSVFTTTGANAIVDWVRVELRDAGDPATVLHAAHALLQADGDIVALDGAGTLTLPMPDGNYYVAVRHRNHLGCMTAGAVALATGPATAINFTTPGTATYGTEGRKSDGSVMLLWAGNTVSDPEVKYTGAQNDRDPIVVRIGGLPTATETGYYPEDVNMDGQVTYTGAGNDREPILINLPGGNVTGFRLEQIP